MSTISLNILSTKRLVVKALVVAIASVGFGGYAHAGLTMNGQPVAKIGWGSSLEQAQAIMYNDTTSNYPNNNSANSYSNTPTITYNSSNTYNNYNSNPTNTNSYNTSNSYNTYSSNNYSTNNNNYTQYNQFSNQYEKLSVSTGSRGVMVVDLVTGEPLYEKNANTARPIASITKIMTAMVVLDAAQNMSDEIKLDSVDFVGPKRASSRLKAGDRLNRAEMLLMMLMKSENPAAKSLARAYPGGYTAFMAAMNQKAQSLGMRSAFFGDPTGLDKRNVASPVDLVKMMKAAGQYDVIRKFSSTPSYDFFVANYATGNRTYKARNTNYMVRDGLYNISMSKTGFINEAGKCVVMETRVNNRPAIVVLLGARNSQTRWGDAKKILDGLSNRRVI